MKYYLGIDLGGTKTAVILADETMTIIDRRKFATAEEGGPNGVMDRIAKTARALYADHGIRTMDVSSCGISAGGPLDPDSGLILSPPNLPGWDRIPMTDLLSQKLETPCFLENDANACALAEWRIGAGRGTSTMIFLTFGTGMGAGLIIGGALHRGMDCLAGEVGHMRIADDGPEGYGKRGSFEGFCSGGGIARLAREEAMKKFAKGESVEFCADEKRLDDITTKDVAEAAARGDGFARSILEYSGEKLGLGLSILIDILNPEAIVIGSIFARCERFLRPAAERVIARETLASSARRCRILPAALGEGIGDYAALIVASEGFKKSRTIVEVV
jgi:glucokinase